MGLDIWFRDDAERLLAGVEQAGLGALRCQADTPEARGYVLGYCDALNAIRLSFGLPAMKVGEKLRMFRGQNETGLSVTI